MLYCLFYPLHGAFRDVIQCWATLRIDRPFSNLEKMSTFVFSVRLAILFVKSDIEKKCKCISHCRKLGVFCYDLNFPPNRISRLLSNVRLTCARPAVFPYSPKKNPRERGKTHLRGNQLESTFCRV
jgi:hypothetical protein